MISEDRKESISIIIELLKANLEHENLFLSFDTEEKRLLFVDRDAYLKEGRFSGFGIPLHRINQIKEKNNEKTG